MNVRNLINIIGADFYTGVPDSQLKSLCNYLMNRWGIDPHHHIIAANEGNATALAAGYNLATGKVPVVYMQNSGEGNAINPITSLLSDRVYAFPVVFILGWRGEPGEHDEPQHVFQGEITTKLLQDLEIDYFVIDKMTSDDEVQKCMEKFAKKLKCGKDVAFVIRKGALTDAPTVDYNNSYVMNREEVIRHIVSVAGEDPIICTTGKASRELFEIRTENKQSHKYDFLTVGSMGHSSSIALGVALNKPNKQIWCIDGDGAVLMHMGAMAVIGSLHPNNLIHVVLNNEAHDSVGGMPTVMGECNLVGVAKACGYPNAVSVKTYDALDEAIKKAQESGQLSFIEAKVAVGSRDNLGRPTTSAAENKNSFANYIMESEL